MLLIVLYAGVYKHCVEFFYSNPVRELLAVLGR